MPAKKKLSKTKNLADALLKYPKTKIASTKQVELTIVTNKNEKGPARDFGLGSVEWHLLDQSELFRELSSRIEGLTTAEQEVKFSEFGPNIITPPRQTHWFVKFLLNLVGGFQVIGLVAINLLLRIDFVLT